MAFPTIPGMETTEAGLSAALSATAMLLIAGYICEMENLVLRKFQWGVRNLPVEDPKSRKFSTLEDSEDKLSTVCNSLKPSVFAITLIILSLAETAKREPSLLNRIRGLA